MEQINNFLKCTPETFMEDEMNFGKILEDHNNWKHIPLVNHAPLHNLKDYSLVRFRGMVQDMMDPEIYLEKYEVKTKGSDKKIRLQEGKYRDCFVMSTEEYVNHDSQENVHGERRTLFLVSIPGLNDWALDLEKKNTNSDTSLFNEPMTSSGVKRSCDDIEQPMEVDIPCNEIVLSNKKVKNENLQSEIPTSGLSSEYLINSPISDRPGKACMIKLYEEFESHTLNTLVDVVGFLSVDPALDGSTIERNDDEFEDMNEIQAANPPPSLIPRIHVIAIRKLKHSNPLLDASLTKIEEENINMENIHKDLKIVLTQCLFGDALAAEYLILHLISTVYVRTELETLGQFSLNLCNIPTNCFEKYTELFYTIIESLLPTSHYLSMTLENLNEKQFIPVKDYTTNKLTSGLLQLAPHTHLVLDETRLQPGKLEASGVKAVQSLARLIKNQSIQYNFKFYDLDFNTNIPVLILSEGRSMLPNNFQVPLNADPENIPLIEETLKAAKHFLQPKLNAIRIYLTKSKLSDFKLNASDSEIIEKDFVEMRKNNPKTDAEVLHKHLIISRLLGIAKGKKYFDNECWSNAKQMEIERNARLDKMPKSTNVRN